MLCIISLALIYLKAKSLYLLISLTILLIPWPLPLWPLPASSFCQWASFSFVTLVCLFCFVISHFSEIIWDLSFSVWLILLSIISSKFIYVVANGKISILFFVWVTFQCVCVSVHMYITYISWWTLRLLLYIGYCK